MVKPAATWQDRFFENEEERLLNDAERCALNAAAALKLYREFRKNREAEQSKATN